MLLKATHLPFVGVIWAFEHFDMYRKPRPGPMSFSGPQTPAAAKRPPRRSVNSPDLFRSDNQATSTSVAAAHSTGRSQPATGQAEPEAQLRTLVINLSAQVEALTAIVSQLQQQREADEVA